MKVNMVFKNGKCLSMDENKIYDWVAIDGDKIVAVGMGETYEDLICESTTVIDAEGNTVMPGFIDSHFHMVQTALNGLSVDLSKARTFDDIADLIIESGNKNPEMSIQGIRLDKSKLKEKRLPTRQEIDRFWNNSAVWLNTYDYLVSALNTYGLLYYKIPFTQIGVQFDEKNMPSGIFKDNANVLLRANILNELDDFYRMEALETLIPKIAEQGLTTVNAMEGGRVYSDKDAEFINNVIRSNKLYVDMELFFQTLDFDSIQRMGLKRIGGCMYVDGTFSSHTAAISFDYFDAPGEKGILKFTQDKLDWFVEQCYHRNYQLALYTLGDRAIDMSIKAHKKAAEITGNTSLRHRLEHVELPTDQHIQSAKELGLIFSMQPSYEYTWGGEGKMYAERLGDKYKLTNPFRQILDGGVKICGGTDSDTTELNYLLGIHSAVNHPVKCHQVSIMDAIRMFTCHGAYAINQENIKGYLEKGYLADIVLLDHDILKSPKAQIKDIKVKMTVKSGKIVYSHNKFMC
ncbi:MAG: amidohydrolase [Aminipila sp.]